MPPSKDVMKKINIIVTDMRASFWDGIPESQQKQTDVQMNDVPIYGLRAYEAFRLLVRAKFRIKENSDFVISTPGQNETVDSQNISKLKDGQHFIILDSRGQKVPFNFNHVVNTIPHTKTITDQDGTYYGNRDQNAAAFAVAELVDNALSATARNVKNRTIEIRFHENGEKSSLHILDNGCGMNSDVLKSGLIFKAPKDDRRMAAKNSISHEETLSQIEDPADENLPMFINSNISKFGMGMKQAIFYLGEDVRIITKSADSQNVSEVFYSKDDLEKKESTTNENPWDVIVHMGLPGQIRSPGTEDDKLLKDLISEEINKPSFTHIIITKIHHKSTEVSDVSRLDLLKKKGVNGVSLEKQLAHIYHYYIHGRDCYDGSGSDPQRPDGLVDLVVTRYVADKILTTNLRNLSSGMENLEHQFIRTAEDTFKFSIEMSEYNTVGETFKVGGIIRYHPFKFNHETHPGGLVTRKISTALDNDDEPPPTVATDNGNGNGANMEIDDDQEDFGTIEPTSSTNTHAGSSYRQSTRKCSNFFHVWWNGRLIPNSKWESFDWCSSPSVRLRANDPIYKCYNRISGSLFFDKHMKSITCTKLEMTVKNQHLEMFNEKKIGGKQATFQRIEVVNGQPKSSRMTKSSKAFETWIRACHKKYDKQVVYSTFIGRTTVKIDEIPLKLYNIYGNAIWDVTLKKGDFVKLAGRGLNRVVGKIQGFLVEADGEDVVVNASQTHAPLAFAKIQQHPQVLFGDEDDCIMYKYMSYIDKTVSSQDIERMIMETVNELQMKMVLAEWTEGQITEGMEVSLDSTLTNRLKIQILKTLDGKLVPGCLFHPLGNKASKKIDLVTRLYRISDDEPPELFFSSHPCQYISANRGYFFKKFNLKSMNVKEPGNYLIQFLSYVDIREDWLNQNQVTSIRPRSRGSSTPNSRAIANQESSNAAISTSSVRNVQPEDPDIDDIGRHTLRYGQTVIPMPKQEIRFIIVPGFPAKVVIEDVAGDEIDVKIGVPFNVRFYFLDDNGNRAKPSELNSPFIPQDGHLLVVEPLKKHTKDNFGLIATHKPPQLVDDDLVVIPDVVLKGVLGGEFRVCRMTARVQLKKLISSGHSGPKFRVLPGIPNQLKVQEDTVRVENGTSVAITCLALDSSGNHVKYSTRSTTEDKKPIMLSCDIYKGKTVRSAKLFEGLKLLSATDIKTPQKIMDIVLDLDELKNGKSDEVQFLCKIVSEEFGIETSVTLTVFPSKRPEKICISYVNPKTGSSTPINPGSQLTRQVNEHITHLTYRVYDGMGNSLDYDDTKYKFTFDWPSRVQMSKAQLDFGELPKMEIPNKVLEDKEVRTTFSSKQRGDDAVELSHVFCLTTTPLEPTELQATGAEHSLGEPLDILVDESLSEDIILTLLDDYGNIVTDLSGNDLSVHDIEVETPEYDVTFEPIVSAGSFIIRHLKFSPPPPIGKRELGIHFGLSLKTTLKLNFVHGKPVGLAFEIDNELIQRNQSVVTLPNMSNARVRILLIDSCRNIVSGVKRCVILLEKHKKLIPGSVVNKVAVNADGIADFKVIKIGVRAEEVSTPCKVKEAPCSNKCFNISYMTATAVWIGGNVSNSNITQAKCNFHILCRPDVPTKLTVNSGQSNQFVYEAGANFAGLTATLETEDDSTIMTSRVQDLTLNLTNTSTNSVFSISPSFFQEGVFGFGGVPGKIGNYSVKFLFDNESTRFAQILREDSLKIIASAVDCLEPEDYDGATSSATPTVVFVSNDPNDRTRRTVTSNLKLYLKDEHKNLISESLSLCPDSMDLNDISGSVKISLSTGQNFNIFENCDVFSKPIPMKNAVAEIPDMILLPETDLPNNSKYTINFATVLKNGNVFAYSLHFTFFNDISQQQERVDLESQRAGLASTIKSKEDDLQHYEQDLKRLTTQVRQLKQIEEVERQAMKWRERRIQTETLEDITARENSLEANKRKIQKSRLDNGCNIERFQCTEAEATHILGPGPIGQLAQIKSEPGGGGLKSQLEVQRMISWHLTEYLPVIVARNDESGKELEKKYSQSSKIFMFANLPRADIKCWNTPIPTKFSTPNYGNPIYARQLLKMIVGSPDDIKICQKVFLLTLGHTIIVNTFDDARHLMRDWNNGALSEASPCPTILSRDGHRLSNIGISTKAPPLDCLPYKFGLAQSDELNLNEEEIKRLAILKSKVKDRMEAEALVEEHIKTNDTRIKKLRQELEECQCEETLIVNKLESLDESQGQRLRSPETRAHRGNVNVSQRISTSESLRSSARIRRSNVPLESPSPSDTPSPSKRVRKS